MMIMMGPSHTKLTENITHIHISNVRLEKARQAEAESQRERRGLNSNAMGCNVLETKTKIYNIESVCV